MEVIKWFFKRKEYPSAFMSTNELARLFLVNNKLEECKLLNKYYEKELENLK